MTTLTPEQQAIADQLLTINAEIEQLTQHADDLKAQLRAALPVGAYTRPDGTRAITITAPVRRFNPDTAQTVLAPELLALCRVTKVDAATAKRVLPPALYEQCQAATGEPGVRLA